MFDFTIKLPPVRNGRVNDAIFLEFSILNT